MKVITLYKSKYANYACVDRSRRVPITRSMCKLLQSADRLLLVTFDNVKYYCVAQYLEKRGFSHFGKVLTISNPAIYIKMLMKDADINLTERLSYHLAHFVL